MRCADAEQEESVGGLGHVEAIEQSFGLISLRSGDVRLAELILHHAGNEVESVAVIVGGGKDDVDDVESGESLARRNLRGIDGRGGFADVDDFTNFLLVVEGDLDGRAGIDLDRRLVQGVEAFLLDMDVVLAGGK